ncbi:MAG: hypothetical protein R3A48_20515 [Polyangiales bacterium]
MAAGDLFEEPHLDAAMAWRERQKATSLTGILNGLGSRPGLPAPPTTPSAAKEFTPPPRRPPRRGARRERRARRVDPFARSAACGSGSWA